MTLLALRAGVRCIQYRRKDATRRELFNEALSLRLLTSDWGATLIVNDHADIARAVEADGVHLGQEDLPIEEARKIVGDSIIGISTHSLREALEAEKKGADYIGFGPIYKTTTKDAGTEKGIDALKEVCHSVNIPVMAIGGISLESLEEIFSVGASSVAVASAICKGDIEENSLRFLRLIKTL
jgi:thiamine-phosphate pyrophosphorylase